MLKTETQSNVNARAKTHLQLISCDYADSQIITFQTKHGIASIVVKIYSLFTSINNFSSALS